MRWEASRRYARFPPVRERHVPIQAFAGGDTADLVGYGAPDPFEQRAIARQLRAALADQLVGAVTTVKVGSVSQVVDELSYDGVSA